MQKPEFDAGFSIAVIAALILAVGIPSRTFAASTATKNGFASKINFHLLGKVRLYVRADKAKICAEASGTTYVCDAAGNLVVFSDNTKRRHDTKVKDFFPPGQKTQLMSTGLDLRTVPFDMKRKTASVSGKLKTFTYPFDPGFLAKEKAEVLSTGIRRYRVKDGHYELYEQMTVSKNVLAFIQKFFGLPPAPSYIPVELNFVDYKDFPREWITTTENHLEVLPDKLFALPNYAKVKTVHGVTADAEDDRSTGEYFESLSKFIHK
jgi:hypothetical protein